MNFGPSRGRQEEGIGSGRSCRGVCETWPIQRRGFHFARETPAGEGLHSIVEMLSGLGYVVVVRAGDHGIPFGDFLVKGSHLVAVSGQRVTAQRQMNRRFG